MTKARNIADLLDANGDVKSASLDNVPASDDASALTTGTLPNARLPDNISDGGTEGTKIATGTTAQRGSTAGQIRFNSTTGLAEYYTGTAFKSIDAPPTVTSLDVTEVDSQAGGNQTIVITGSGFNSGATVIYIGASGTDFNASTVTVDSATQITAVAPKASFLNAQEPYGVKVTNTSGLSAILASQINVDTSPSWSTSSGSLGTLTEGASVNLSATATDADGDTIVYSVQSGSLPAGSSLNTSTGAITGTLSDVSADTTSNFTLRATANTKTADRAFSIITTNTPTFSQIMTAQTAGSNRNLAILIDPANYTSGSTANNESGHPVANSSTPLNNLTIGGTGAGKYFEATSGSGGRYMHFGAPTGLTNNSLDAWGYAGWWRPNFEVDDTSNGNMLWLLNDGDWSPNGQIGIRFGQGGKFRTASGSTSPLTDFGLPSATYTDKWIFLCVWHRLGGGRFLAQGFATDTNLTLHANDTTGSSTGNGNGYNLMIGARPDAPSGDTIPAGTRIGGQMAWFASNGTDSFITSSEGVSQAQTKFEAIFDATKGRYA